MSIESHDDPWLSPNRQAEFPTRSVLSAVKLHRRREKTFLVLAALVMLSTVALPLLGTGLLLDVNYMIDSAVPGLALPSAELAFGVLVMPLGMFAVSLVAELYGRRRAYAMAFVGFLTSLAAIGLLYASERIGGEPEAVGAAVALAVAAFVGQFVIVPVHSNMRRNSPERRIWSRKLASTFVALLATWTVFAFTLYAHAVQMYGRAEDAVVAEIGRLVLGGAAYTVVVALLDVLPFVALSRGLAVYLRVGQFEEDEDEDSLSERSWSGARRYEGAPSRQKSPRVASPGSGTSRYAPPSVPAPSTLRAESAEEVSESAVISQRAQTGASDGSRPRRDSALPPAQIVDTPPPIRRTKPRTSIQPFSSAEMRFFTEGEELADASVEPTDSKSARV